MSRKLTRNSITDYEIFVDRGELGRGQWGVVYEGRHRARDLRVAIKVTFDPSKLRRFVEREQPIITKLQGRQHENIVTVFDCGVIKVDGDDLIPYLCMEYLGGGSFKKKLNEDKDKGRHVERLLQVARGVECAHSTRDPTVDRGFRAIVHRDIKPDNILFSGDGATAKLTDFGLAKELGTETLTDSAGFLATLAYAAPETLLPGIQAAEQPADIYSLGAILYEILVGSYPFYSDLAAILTAAPAAARTATIGIVCDPNKKPDRPSDFDPALRTDPYPALEDACLKCLEKEPALRPDIGQFIEALEKFHNSYEALWKETR
jgi:serine/threonine-protein kinase